MEVAEGPGAFAPGFDVKTFKNAFAKVPILSKFHVAPAMTSELRRRMSAADVVHAHGLWLFPTRYAVNEARRAGKPYMISPHGMLAPAALKFGAIQKRLYWRAHQKAALERAACLHATSEQEWRDIRTAGINTPVAVIPHGAEPPPPTRAVRDPQRKILLSLGRRHPIKGLDDLIAAWARIETRHPDWRLRIAGPSEQAYEDYLRNLAARLEVRRIEFLGRQLGQDKAEAFAAASLFVLPSRSENFAMTVPEAMSHGVPVIASKGTPWSQLSEQGCGWWIDHGVESLAAALDAAMSLSDDQLAEMGECGRAWVARDFTLDAVAARFEVAYRWMQKKAEAPPFIRFE